MGHPVHTFIAHGEVLISTKGVQFRYIEPIFAAWKVAINFHQAPGMLS